jgi:hypothetical protein
VGEALLKALWPAQVQVRSTAVIDRLSTVKMGYWPPWIIIGCVTYAPLSGVCVIKRRGLKDSELTLTGALDLCRLHVMKLACHEMARAASGGVQAPALYRRG